MDTPYLIQRAKFSKHNNSDAIGIDRLLNFDYMGSAEFEFGALPKSLKRVRENISDYVQFNYSFQDYTDKTITVLCKKEYEKYHVPAILEKLAIREIRLKHYIDLPEWLRGNETYHKTDFWWDIENDWFFWKQNDEFAVSFINSLNKTK